MGARSYPVRRARERVSAEDVAGIVALRAPFPDRAVEPAHDVLDLPLLGFRTTSLDGGLARYVVTGQFLLTFDPVTPLSLGVTVEEWVARRICKYDELDAEERYPWLLTGQPVGFGPDHEPLLQNAGSVTRVGTGALHEARRVYEERFDVGQDARS